VPFLGHPVELNLNFNAQFRAQVFIDMLVPALQLHATIVHVTNVTIHQYDLYKVHVMHLIVFDSFTHSLID